MRKSKKLVCLVLAVFMLMGVPAFGYGETEGTDWGKTLSPYFLVEGVTPHLISSR